MGFFDKPGNYTPSGDWGPPQYQALPPNQGDMIKFGDYMFNRSMGQRDAAMSQMMRYLGNMGFNFGGMPTSNDMNGVYSQMNNIRSQMLGGPQLGTLDAGAQGALNDIRTAEQGAANLAYDQTRDKSIAALYAGGMPRSSIALDQMGRLGYGHAQEMANIEGDIGQKGLDLRQFISNLILQRQQGALGSLQGEGGLRNDRYSTDMQANLQRLQALMGLAGGGGGVGLAGTDVGYAPQQMQLARNPLETGQNQLQYLQLQQQLQDIMRKMGLSAGGGMPGAGVA